MTSSAAAGREPAAAGCLRTLTGARQSCAVRSYPSTAAKHDLSFLNVLVMLTENRPWMLSAACLKSCGDEDPAELGGARSALIAFIARVPDPGVSLNSTAPARGAGGGWSRRRWS